MEDLNKIVADNLVYYRKNAKLTQAELAEKISYSDKAVSKWERGETIPDLQILTKLAEIYGITLNDFVVAEHKTKAPKTFSIKQTLTNKKLLITLLSCSVVWLLATILFVTCLLVPLYPSDSWKIFIYAIPVSFLVAFIFSCIWGNLEIRVILLSIFVWSVFLAIYLSFTLSNIWLIFMIAIPIQVAIIMWYFLARQVQKIKLHKESLNKDK